MFNHLQSPLLITQSQLIKHVLTNPSRQLSVKQARLPLESKNTFSTSMTIALKKSFAYTWISPPPPPGIRWFLRKPKNACSNYSWWKTSQDLQGSLRIVKHLPKILKDKDLWKVFKDLYMQYHLLRSSRIWPRSSKDPTKILIKILAKIFARILQDPRGLNKDLSKILKLKDPFKDLFKILVRILKDLVRIFLGSLSRSLQDLCKDPSRSSKTKQGSFKDL